MLTCSSHPDMRVMDRVLQTIIYFPLVQAPASPGHAEHIAAHKHQQAAAAHCEQQLHAVSSKCHGSLHTRISRVLSLKASCVQATQKNPPQLQYWCPTTASGQCKLKTRMLIKRRQQRARQLNHMQPIPAYMQRVMRKHAFKRIGKRPKQRPKASEALQGHLKETSAACPVVESPCDAPTEAAAPSASTAAKQVGFVLPIVQPNGSSCVQLRRSVMNRCLHLLPLFLKWLTFFGPAGHGCHSSVGYHGTDSSSHNTAAICMRAGQNTWRCWPEFTDSRGRYIRFWSSQPCE